MDKRAFSYLYMPKKKGFSLYISSSDITVLESSFTGKAENQKIYKINAAAYYLLFRRKEGDFEIFTVSLTDIE